ncbi:DUF58 domain-containing protein [bacterium]|nr:DUF58 domain-containing protein [bacterium]
MRPTFRLIGAIFLIGATVFLGGIFPQADRLSELYAMILCAAVILDALYLNRVKVSSAKREVETLLSNGVESAVKVSIVLSSASFLRITAIDSVPEDMLHKNPLKIFPLSTGILREYSYEILPRKRGIFDFGEILIKAESPIGLFSKKIKTPATQEVKVYPDISIFKKYGLFIQKGLSHRSGIRLGRMRGEGTEIESLREYHRDDDFRWIEWKATARRGKPISKNFQPEKNQSILLMLDAGRNMINRVGVHTKFDHMMNTAALLIYVSHHFNDRIGVMVFGDEVISFIKQDKGKTSPMRILDRIYNLQPRFCESDYETAYGRALTELKRRTLVVTFTDLLDPYSSERVIKYNQMISSKHLPLVVSVSDSDLKSETLREASHPGDVFRKFASQELMEDYKRSVKLLSGRGVDVVSVPAAELSISTINKYLKIKTRGRL